MNAPLQKRILVTGGAGFVGSNLVDVLMQQGHIVYVLDNLFTGHRRNIEHWIGHPVRRSARCNSSPRAFLSHPRPLQNFTFFLHDVIFPFFAEVVS